MRLAEIKIYILITKLYKILFYLLNIVWILKSFLTEKKIDLGLYYKI